MSSRNHSLTKILKYCFFGVLTAGIEFISFLLLDQMLHIYIASTVSFLVGLVSSFIFNKFFVFKNSHHVRKGEVAQFFLLGLFNSQLSSVITLGASFVLPGYIAKLVSMVCIAVWNYIIMNFIIFQKDRTSKDVLQDDMK